MIHSQATVIITVCIFNNTKTTTTTAKLQWWSYQDLWQKLVKLESWVSPEISRKVKPSWLSEEMSQFLVGMLSKDCWNHLNTHASRVVNSLTILKGMKREKLKRQEVFEHEQMFETIIDRRKCFFRTDCRTVSIAGGEIFHLKRTAAGRGEFPLSNWQR